MNLIDHKLIKISLKLVNGFIRTNKQYFFAKNSFDGFLEKKSDFHAKVPKLSKEEFYSNFDK